MDGDHFLPRALALREPDLRQTDLRQTDLRETGWLQDAAPRRAGLFLQRDLSDHALRRPTMPVFDAAALAVARQAGFEAGCEAGLEAAAGARATAEAAALGLIAAALADAQVQAAAVADRAADALARTLVAALHAVMPELVRRTALTEAHVMLAQVLPGLSREAHVSVVVASALVPGVVAAVGLLAPESRDRMAVTGLDELPCGEVRVRWACGQARRQPAQLWQAVMDVFEPALAQPCLSDSDVPEPAFKDNDDGQ